MSEKDWTLWRGLVIWAKARRIREAHARAVYREYNEFWKENNRDFIRQCDKEYEMEIEHYSEHSDDTLSLRHISMETWASVLDLPEQVVRSVL